MADLKIYIGWAAMLTGMLAFLLGGVMPLTLWLLQKPDSMRGPLWEILGKMTAGILAVTAGYNLMAGNLCQGGSILSAILIISTAAAWIAEKTTENKPTGITDSEPKEQPETWLMTSTCSNDGIIHKTILRGNRHQIEQYLLSLEKKERNAYAINDWDYIGTSMADYPNNNAVTPYIAVRLEGTEITWEAERLDNIPVKELRKEGSQKNSGKEATAFKRAKELPDNIL